MEKQLIGLARPSALHLPDSVDWRQKGAVTPVRDQGQCEASWAFACIAAVESQHAIVTGNLIPLSDQNVADCSSPESDTGCTGGFMEQGYQYIIDNKGVDTLASYPNNSTDNLCHFKPEDVGATIDAYATVSTGSELALQTATANIGPVSVAIDASSYEFQFYSDGVYVDTTCTSTFLDHAVTVVGYDSLDNVPYWTVKNSWGLDWGKEGYILMARNQNNMCGIATDATYPIINKK
jgi:cathepsin L